MSHRTRPTALSALLYLGFVPLSGCASDRAFPSLAPRPIEAIARRPERTAPAAPTKVDSALVARVATLTAALDANGRTWATTLAATRSVVDRARGRPVGDDAWVSAQQAISRLEPIRQAAGALVEDLDALRMQQAQRPDPVDTGSLDAAWTKGVAQLDAQSAAYRAVSTILPTG